MRAKAFSGVLGSAIVALALSAGAASAQQCSNDGSRFNAWKAEFRQVAAANGVGSRGLTALDQTSYNTRTISADRNQRSFRLSLDEFMQRRGADAITQRGIRLKGQHAGLLQRIEQQYGVPPGPLLAIWGMETNFGSFMGGNNTIHALATLTEKRYRASFFRSELVTALRIVSDGHIAPNAMVGSWAGAMGHTQFMPSSFMRYAVDYNGDGRKDIWNSVPDALGSTANYLKSFNWRPGETWGYEVKLPQGFNFAAAREMGKAPLSQWQAMGISRASGSVFPRPGDMARLYMPAGASGPAFLLLPNFDVIKRYNNSDSYALAVGHLADRILGGGPFVTPWPSGDYALSKAQRAEVQALLGRAGYNVGTADGVIGPKTRAGVIAYQQARGLPADGHVSGLLLERLKR